jgi:hypothetical protein
VGEEGEVIPGVVILEEVQVVVDLGALLQEGVVLQEEEAGVVLQEEAQGVLHQEEDHPLLPGPVEVGIVVPIAGLMEDLMEELTEDLMADPMGDHMEDLMEELTEDLMADPMGVAMEADTPDPMGDHMEDLMEDVIGEAQGFGQEDMVLVMAYGGVGGTHGLQDSFPIACGILGQHGSPITR